MNDFDTTVYVNGALVKKSEAAISVYDSGFLHGDGVYEGIRLYKEGILLLDAHIKRLYESAYTMDIDVGITRSEMCDLVKRVFAANELKEDLHMRLMVTRGKKKLTGMNPKFNEGGPASIVALVDYKKPIFDKNGIVLSTCSMRRTRPTGLDAKTHNMNQLGQILASIECNRHGADEAIMLDDLGFITETNGTTMFMVKDGVVCTPTLDYILPGLTRELVLKWAAEANIPTLERNFSLHEFYNADEAFITGTVGEVVPVKEIDGHKIGVEVPGKITRLMMETHVKKRAELCTPMA